MHFSQLDLFNNVDEQAGEYTRLSFSHCWICGRYLFRELHIPISPRCLKNMRKEIRKMNEPKYSKLIPLIDKMKSDGFAFLRVSGDDTNYNINSLPGYLYENEEDYYLNLCTKNSAILLKKDITPAECAENRPMCYFALFKRL